jgi:hypothetical protein
MRRVALGLTVTLLVLVSIGVGVAVARKILAGERADPKV